MSEAIYQAAIQYTSAGMSVIPVRREDKKPVVPWKEYQTNIATEEQLKTWFLNTDHNIAIITGEISNVCVVDLDGADGIAWGRENLKPTITVKTARGFHLYYQYEPGSRNFSNKKGTIKNFPQDIDFRGEAGYVVAPPSIHASGFQYKWVKNKDVSGFVPEAIAKLPQVIKKHAVKELITKPIENNDLIIEKIKEISIFDVAQKLGVDLSQIKNNQIMCPGGHDNKTAGFTFYQESNSFHCFGCGASGDNINLAKFVLRSDSFPFILDWFKQKYSYLSYIKPDTPEENIIRPEKKDIFDIIIENQEKLNIKTFCEEVIKSPKETLSKDNKCLIVIEALFQTCNKIGVKFLYYQESYYIWNLEYWQYISTQELMQFFPRIGLKQGFSTFDIAYFKEINNMIAQLKIRCHPVMPPPKNIIINFNNTAMEIYPDGKIVTREFRPSDMMFFKLDFNYDPNATAPLWQEFLNRFQPDLEVQNVIQEYLGYIFTKNSNLKLEKMMFLMGEGNNGKSTIAEVMMQILGHERVSNVSLEELSIPSNRGLLGRSQLNFCTDIGSKFQFDLFKRLASNEPIIVSEKYKLPYTLIDYSRFIVNTNNHPNIEHTDAFFRRMLIIPFKIKIQEKDIDRDFRHKLFKELPGIMNWIIVGLKRLSKNRNFSQSAELTNTINQYRTTSDSVGQFMQENPDRFDFKEPLLIDIYKDYKQYCHDYGMTPLGKLNFSRRLEKQGYVICKGSGNKTIIKKYEDESDLPPQDDPNF